MCNNVTARLRKSPRKPTIPWRGPEYTGYPLALRAGTRRHQTGCAAQSRDVKAQVLTPRVGRLMLTGLGVFIALLAAATPAAAGLWWFGIRRSQRRNGRGECGSCSQLLGSDSEERFLVGGRLICVDCARRLKKRMPWLLGAATVLITGAGVGAGMAADGLEWVLGPLVTISLGLGALQTMKAANRRAQRRLAEGESEQISSGGSDSTEPEAVRLTSGTPL